MTEFGLIDAIKGLCRALPTNGYEGIGDDCAVFPIDAQRALLFTADMLVERVHFLRDATSAYDLGHKSLAVNLSDIAAMGGRPTATLLSLSIPQELMGEWIEEFMRGYRDLALQHGVALIGGDTTASKGDLSINVTAIGEVELSRIKRRSAAQVGDVIFVTNELGGSAAGLNDIFSGDFDSTFATLHKRPTPRVAEGVWLSQHEAVHAMMDISDGVASDLRHILRASEVGAELELSATPRPDGVSVEQALSGGEDYELLFSASADNAEQLAHDYAAQFGHPIKIIGKIVEGNDIAWFDNGAIVERSISGFTHY